MKTTGVLAAIGVGGAIPASAETAIPEAPVPNDTDELTYATMGTDPNNPTATVYGNFKCPFTQKFVREGNLEAVLNEYVTSGEMNLRFRALAYQPPGTSSHGTSTYYISDSDPLISESALSVWDVSPDDYWQFFDYMFSGLISGNVSFSEMKGRMQTADVSDRGTIIDRASSGRFDDTVEENRYDAGDYGVTFTPTMVLDGETIAPHHDTDTLLNWIGGQLSSASDFSPEETTTSESSSESTDSNDTSNSEDGSNSDAASDSTDSEDTQSSSNDEDSSKDTTAGGTKEDSDQSSESSKAGSQSSAAETQSSTSKSKDASTNDEDNPIDSSEPSTDDVQNETISIREICRIILNPV
ncbi:MULTISPECIES: thioredoxin domain-containing protein [unclassified Haladaptatus]|uniref:DsbA family protein n=1 Tax=unclassified Haladaptatus TaxID=2622732 RepID=UPI00209BFA92|nr:MULTISPECIES: thioredoxin domain-containing protein [unclassified Haladaptatus]MCO8243451.1 thioredoxin domain-containing protein [Haladaptatus sp. AB643]MCO8254860.1 thioredoxin domain-containing protein [Haladaptatus sp. AB618]